MANSGARILFFAEGATLAHVARPFVLAGAIAGDRYQVSFARPDAFAWLTDGAPFRVSNLNCQNGETFTKRLEAGRPLYDFSTLVRYVEDDLALIDSERPDVIVGDFRLSLAVSARLRKIPYITLCDAYWSPGYGNRAPLPVLGFTRFTPIPVAELVFRCVSGFAMRLHSIPLERLRAHFGLPSLGYQLRRNYTEANLRLFANFPALFPEVSTSSDAEFIGPLAWSPAAPSTGLDFLGRSEPLIYVTMGSSGDTRVLEALLPILERTGAIIAVATAGKPLPAGLTSSNARIFDYLPGELVCQHATLVVCNGGSPTTNQALSAGVPVLGIPRNMDQFLNMQAIVQFGAGLLIRADRVGATQLTNAVRMLLHNESFRVRATILAKYGQSNQPAAEFHGHITRLLARHTYGSA